MSQSNKYIFTFLVTVEKSTKGSEVQIWWHSRLRGRLESNMRGVFFYLSSVQVVLFHTFQYTGSFTRNPLKAYCNSHIFGW